MALSDKDILITPNKGSSTDDPKIEFVGATSSSSSTITAKVYDLDGGTLSFEGTAGQLFSITNSLSSGSIFSVNDVSGIPSIDVNANGTILIAPFESTPLVGIGTSSPTVALDVVGNISNTGTLSIKTSGSSWTTTLTSSPNRFGTDVPGLDIVSTHPSLGTRGGIYVNGGASGQIKIYGGIVDINWDGPNSQTPFIIRRNNTTRLAIFDDVVTNGTLEIQGPGTSSAIEINNLDNLTVPGNGASFVRWKRAGTSTNYNTSGGLLTIGPYYAATDRELAIYGDNSNHSWITTGTANVLYIGTNKTARVTFSGSGNTTNFTNTTNSGLTINSNVIWNAGNDGAGSGLDADLLDGQQGSYYLNYNNFTNTPTIPTNNNQLTNGAGYITSSGSITGSAGTLDGIDSSQFLRSDANDSASGVIDFLGGSSSTPAVRIKSGGTSWSEGLAIHPSSDNGFALSFYRTTASLTTNTNTWAIGNLGTNSTNNFGLLRSGLTGGSGIRVDSIFDVTQSGTFRFGFTPTVGSNTIWHAGNDGSGSGLDADLLDGQQGSYYLNTSSTVQTKAGDLRIGGSGYNIAIGINNTTASSSVGRTATYNEGIFWHSSNTEYAIFRTAGGWSNPDYQQLELNWPTGIRLDGGTAYGQSGVKVIGNNNSLTVNGNVAWNAGNDGAGSGLDADLLDGQNLVNNAATANTVAGRNASGDIDVRLIRQTYADQSTISGGLVFRINNSSDNYLRVCNNTGAIRTFLNVPTRTGANASGTWGINITGNAATATNAGTLDGIDSSQFLRSDADDTTTGNLVISDKYLRVGRPVSDTASMVRTNTALEVSSLGVDQTASQTNVMRLLRDGTSGVVYAGAADFDLYRHTASGVAPNVGLEIKLSTSNTSTYYSALKLQSNGVIQTGGNTIWHSGNDGAGSGLDADLLDGQQGSYYAPKASPALTGTPTAPTASAGTNTTQLATTAFVSTAVSNLVDSAPTTLDTLNELAAALGDDPNFATTITNSLATKLSTTTQFGGDVSGTYNAIVVANDSHTHDTRYYTETESDARYLGINDKAADSDLLDGQQGSYYQNASNINSGTLNDSRLSYTELGRSPVGNFGQWANHSSFTDFNTPPTYWGWTYMNGTTNAPNTSSNQWYRGRFSLGNQYGLGSDAGDYWMEMTIPRSSQGGAPGNLWIRTCENGVEQSWYQVAATVSGNTTWHAGNDGAGSGLDADLLDGQQGSYYLDYNNFTNTPTIPTNNNQLTNGAGYVTAGGTVQKANTVALTAEGTINATRYLVFTDQSATGTGSLKTSNALTYNPSTDLLYANIYGTATNATNVAIADAGNSSVSHYVALTAYTGSNQPLKSDVQLRYSPSTNILTASLNGNATTATNISGYSGTYWTSNNDGAGSGLDADLLDGVQGASYLRSDVDDTFTRLSGTRVSCGYDSGSDNSVGCSNWFRSSGATGWYNATYAGGWYMSDTTWIRTYNNKSIYHNTGTLRTDGNLQVGANGATFNAPSGGTVTISGSTVWHAGNDGAGSGLDADLLDGYSASTTRNAANTIPVRDGNGYLQLGWINTTSGATTSTINKIYASNDSYVRYVTPATLISQLAIWTSGNDGSGSGLDADLLDGLNAATTGANTIVRTDASGNIAASGNVTAYSSDRRLKENLNHIESPVEKVQKLNGYTFDWNEKSKELGFTPKHEKNDIGLIAQEVEDILPQAVAPAPFDTKSNGESKSGENYLTIQYERLVPLLVEAIKEQQNQINKLTQEIEHLKTK